MMLLVSCEPEPMMPEPEILDNCGLEVTLEICDHLGCNGNNPFVNHKVELYESIESAFDGEDPIDSIFTNENGWGKFFDLLCDVNIRYIVRADLGEYGIYIDDTRFSNTQNQIVKAWARENMLFTNSSFPRPLVEYVSIDQIAWGQESTYSQFVNPNGLSYDASSWYTGKHLHLQVGQQIGERKFIMRESENSSGEIFIYTWEISDDSLFVSQYLDQPFGSNLWDLNENSADAPTKLAFPLDNQVAIGTIDMNQDFEFPIPSWDGYGAASDYTLFDQLFEGLTVFKNFDANENTDLSLQVYNKEYGVIRTIQFQLDGNGSSSGFDLQIVN